MCVNLKMGYNQIGKQRIKRMIEQMVDHLKGEDRTQENVLQIYGEDRNRMMQYSYGQWDQQETQLYFIFIYHHKTQFQTKSLRKSFKIFKQMSKFIKTRTSSQCRTHHHNLMNKTKNIESLLKCFIKSSRCFLQKYRDYKKQLEILEDMQFCEDTSTVIRECKKQGGLQGERQGFGDQKLGFGVEVDLNVKMLKTQRMLKMMECQKIFSLWMQKVNKLSCV